MKLLAFSELIAKQLRATGMALREYCARNSISNYVIYEDENQSGVNSQEGIGGTAFKGEGLEFERATGFH